MLDSGHCGVDNQNFSQYAAYFVANAFCRIDSIYEGIPVEKLMEICPGMPLGIAYDIIKYARKVVEKIQRKEKKKHRRG